MSNRLRIQTLICDTVNGSKFFEVKYTPGTGKPIPYDPEIAALWPAESVRTNEVSSSFAVDTKYGREEIEARTSWTFELYLEWSNKEIDLTPFEEAWMKNIPRLQKDGEERSARLFLTRKEVTHPVQQDASTGTQAKFLITVKLGKA